MRHTAADPSRTYRTATFTKETRDELCAIHDRLVSLFNDTSAWGDAEREQRTSPSIEALRDVIRHWDESRNTETVI